MSQLVYYLLLKPLSRLPFSVLYFCSDILAFILYRIVGFRRKVVLENIKNAFPDYSNQQVKATAKQFYQHFCDLILESVKLFSILEEEAVKRCKVVNPELLDYYHEQGRNISLITGHYANWELAAVALNSQIKTQPIAIYKPLKNKTFDEFLKRTRAKFGLQLVPKHEVRKVITAAQDISHAIIFENDQCPTSRQKVYWVDFLNQPTAVMMGVEVYAKRYNYVVVMAKVKKLHRGFYVLVFELLSEQPRELAVGELSTLHTRTLEKQILEAPPFWLWSHRRWKRSRADYVKNVN